ncbi:MAG: hypothetical protein ABIJ92_02000 [Candidatus Aenigmatarchaeota archaeon]
MKNENIETKNKDKENDKSTTSVVLIALLIVGVLFVGFNQYNINQVQSKIDGFTRTGIMSFDSTQTIQKKNVFTFSVGGDVVSAALEAVIPTGVTPYGNGELSYDDVVGGINILKAADIGITTESLTEDQLQRYIYLGTHISCEYCCSAKMIVFPNGAPACGCAHSYAMRGLAKYLLVEYGDEYSDEDIMMEMTKWKNLFFPRNTVEKAVALIENDMEITPDALNDHELLTKISSGDTSSIGQLSGMVGAC